MIHHRTKKPCSDVIPKILRSILWGKARFIMAFLPIHRRIDVVLENSSSRRGFFEVDTHQFKQPLNLEMERSEQMIIFMMR